MELWDAYDVDFRKIEGKTLVRGQPIPQGMYHLVCDILVRHADGTYLIMQRDACKHHGLMWEATSGGSALQGETPLQCAKRELHEETGIVADELAQVGRTTEGQSHYFEFLCVTDWPKQNITLQQGETVDFRWVSRNQLFSMSADRLLTQRMQQFIEELQGR